MIPTDQMPQLRKLLKRQRRATWLIGIGLALTALGYICSRDPAWHVASSTKPGVPYPAPQQPAASYNSPPAAAPYEPPTAAPPSAEMSPAEAAASEDTTFVDFSFEFVRLRFARTCPQVEVTRLPRPLEAETRLPGWPCSGTYMVILYTPPPVTEEGGTIAYGVMGSDESGTGTRLHLWWNCALRLRPGASETDVAGVTIVYATKDFNSTEPFTRAALPVATVVGLSEKARR